MTTLTPQREKFAQGVASGLSQAEAYRQAYPKSEKWKDQSVWRKASELFSDVKVMARVEELRAEQRKLALWTFEQSVEKLRMVLDKPDKASDIVAAIKELNAMHGFKAPENLNVNLHNKTKEERDRIARAARGDADL